jgi:hypothetical protein
MTSDRNNDPGEPTKIYVKAFIPIVLQIALIYADSTYFLNLLTETGLYKQPNTL